MLVVYPMIYEVLAPSQVVGWEWDFLNLQQIPAFVPSGGSPCLIAGSKRFDSSNDSEELHLHKGRTVWDSCIFGEAVKKVMNNCSMTFFC